MAVISSMDRAFAQVQSLPHYQAVIDESLNSDLEVNYIGLVDRPAIERNFQAFKAQHQRAKFNIDPGRQVIAGPAMIADMPIYRKDNQLGEYYVVFDKAAIQTIVEKFSAKGYLKNFNLFHDQQKRVSDVTIFNSFISDKTLGIAPMAGFEDIADGSWFISAKVNNPDVWQAVKSGEIKGFSVEGLFNYVPAKFIAAPQKPSAPTRSDLYTARLMAEMLKHPAAFANIKAIIGGTNEGKEQATMNRITAVLKTTSLTAYNLWSTIITL